MNTNKSTLTTLFKQVPVIPASVVPASGIPDSNTKYKKQKIPAAMREAVWITRCGRVFEHKCLTSWCLNKITVFDFQSGHNIPESKGGKTCVDNLYPLCARCNLSMGDRHTFDEWTAMRSEEVPKKRFSRFFSCFNGKT